MEVIKPIRIAIHSFKYKCKVWEEEMLKRKTKGSVKKGGLYRGKLAECAIALHFGLDFKKVIDIKVREWAKNPEMEGYLRPHTLFGNKFESYLNQKAAQEHGGITYEKYNKKKQ